MSFRNRYRCDDSKRIINLKSKGAHWHFKHRLNVPLSGVICVPREENESKANAKNSVILGMRVLNVEQKQQLPSPSRRGLHSSKESQGQITAIRKGKKE